jgi:hypothetical protein
MARIIGDRSMGSELAVDVMLFVWWRKNAGLKNPSGDALHVVEG